MCTHKEVIYWLLAANGPQTVTDIRIECIAQVTPEFDEDQMVRDLNLLITEGTIEIEGILDGEVCFDLCYEPTGKFPELNPRQTHVVVYHYYTGGTTGSEVKTHVCRALSLDEAEIKCKRLHQGCEVLWTYEISTLETLEQAIANALQEATEPQ